MDIVVLAGGLSAERNVSFQTGSMVAQALRKNGHRVILLDVFMGYSDREEDLNGIFDKAEQISVTVGEISETAPDLQEEKISPQDFSDRMSSGSARWRILFLWDSTGKTVRTAGYRGHLTFSESNTPEAVP